MSLSFAIAGTTLTLILLSSRRVWSTPIGRSFLAFIVSADLWALARLVSENLPHGGGREPCVAGLRADRLCEHRPAGVAGFERVGALAPGGRGPDLAAHVGCLASRRSTRHAAMGESDLGFLGCADGRPPDAKLGWISRRALCDHRVDAPARSASDRFARGAAVGRGERGHASRGRGGRCLARLWSAATRAALLGSCSAQSCHPGDE